MAIQTREILGDTRGYGRRVLSGQMLSHAVEVVGGRVVRALCGGVKAENFADADAGNVDAVPTCRRCAARDPRRS